MLIYLHVDDLNQPLKATVTIFQASLICLRVLIQPLGQAM